MNQKLGRGEWFSTLLNILFMPVIHNIMLVLSGILFGMSPESSTHLMTKVDYDLLNVCHMPNAQYIMFVLNVTLNETSFKSNVANHVHNNILKCESTMYSWNQRLLENVNVSIGSRRARIQCYTKTTITF